MPIHACPPVRHGRERLLDGLRVAVCSHIEAKTGVYIESLAVLGAEVMFTSSEPMSTQDDVVAARAT